MIRFIFCMPAIVIVMELWKRYQLRKENQKM